MKKNFQFAGHTFQGIRQFTENEDFCAITKQMQSPVTGLGDEWNWDNFFHHAEPADSEDYDIFLMDGKYEVVPAHNALFLWGKEAERRYSRDCAYLADFDAMTRALDSIRTHYISLLKSMCKDYNLTNISISDTKEMVHASFHRGGMYSEVVRSVELMDDGSVRFGTYDGPYYDTQLVTGLEQLVKKTRDIIALLDRKDIHS